MVLCRDLNFPRYNIRRKSTWARKYNRKERECKTNPCEVGELSNSALNFEQLKCIRNCLSASCYNEIYAWDELEEGEIDIRASSFKGCTAFELRRNSSTEL